MTDRKITRFQLELTVKDSGTLVEKESTLVRPLMENMREKGYVPVLDLGVYRTVHYNEDDDTFAYVFTAHGVFVGRKRAWDIEGLVNGKLMEKGTHDSKSEPS